MNQWRYFSGDSYDKIRIQPGNIGNPPLIRRAGQYVPQEIRSGSWPTPISLRDVDVECKSVITTLYNFHLSQEELNE